MSYNYTDPTPSPSPTREGRSAESLPPLSPPFKGRGWGWGL